jgi:hypothetical protein
MEYPHRLIVVVYSLIVSRHAPRPCASSEKRRMQINHVGHLHVMGTFELTRQFRSRLRE